MLQELKVKNYLFIDSLEVNFESGFSVVTGETGSGKSIFLEAIQGLISPRLSTDVIKPGANKCYLEGTFKLTLGMQKALEEWKQENKVDEDDFEIITISREISEKGSKGRINGVLLPARTIQSLGDVLLEIHGQNTEHQILSPRAQLSVIDEFLGPEHLKEVIKYKNLFSFWKDLANKLKAEKDKVGEKDRELDFINFQLNELNSLEIENAEEEDELKQQVTKLSKMEELQKTLDEVQDLYFESESNVSSSLSIITKKIGTLSKGDEALSKLVEQLSEIQDQLTETIQEFCSYAASDELEVDLDSLNQRLSQIQKIKRKHNVASLDALLELKAKLEEHAEYLSNLSINLEKQEKDCEKKYKELKLIAAELSKVRLKAAEQVSALVSAELEDLGLKAAKFKISLHSLEELNSDGSDKIEFLFMANAGDILRPLSKVASGGELSRIMLILKSITGSGNTIIFDEIDTGTSGRVSRMIGEKLYKLSLKHQVLCVTHQPLIAAIADHHFSVSKSQSENKTTLDLKDLCSEEEKMLALIDLMIGERDMILAQQYAKDLIEESKKRKIDLKQKHSLNNSSRANKTAHKNKDKIDINESYEKQVCHELRDEKQLQPIQT
ncbi:MAG: DNA repair protein RecN [Candidatus Caenarcaniphilales bacterium]|nr:DNA repair protein RecN [Candidatus Caenarcaniphilales bacterium]